MANTWEYTEEHKKLVPAWNKKWIEGVIMSTESIDKDICETQAKELYKVANLDEPEVGFVRSIATGNIVASTLCTIEQLKKDPLDSGLEYNKETVKALIDYACGLCAQISDEAAMDCAKVLSELADIPEESGKVGPVEEVFWKVRGKIGKIMAGGNEYASDECFLTFVRDVIGFDCEEYKNYKCWELLSIHGGVRWVHEKFCLISDRPLSIHTNQNNLLHNEEGPAKEYRDGFKMWYIEGVKVNEQIVMRPEEQSVEDILNEENEEVRRIRIMRYGDRIFEEANAKEINRRENYIENTRETLLEIRGQRFLRTFCPTQKEIYLIPVEGETCEEAQSWLWGVESAQTAIVGRT